MFVNLSTRILLQIEASIASDKINTRASISLTMFVLRERQFILLIHFGLVKKEKNSKLLNFVRPMLKFVP